MSRVREALQVYANGEPLTRLSLSAALTVPWRLARLEGAYRDERVRLEAGRGRERTLLLEDIPEQPGLRASGERDATVRSLSPWRTGVGPQSFLDIPLHTALDWIAGQCGGRLESSLPNPKRRHLAIPKLPAYQALVAVLAAYSAPPWVWLDHDGALWIGPEEENPYARTALEVEPVRLVSDGAGLHLELPAAPGVWPGTRLEVRHPLYTGRLRVTEAHLTVSPSERRSRIWAVPV